MEITRRRKMSKANQSAMILSVVLMIVLAVLLVIDGQQNKKLSQELTEAAKRQAAEKKAFLETVESEYKSDMAVVGQYLPGIVCWGDSLTAGAGGDGVTYPKVIQTLIQENICDPYDPGEDINRKYAYLLDDADYKVEIPVVNMGVGGETSITIVGRNGAIPYVVKDALTIPGDTTPVEIHFTSKEGQHVAPLRQLHSGVNPVIIGGVEGTLSIQQESWMSKEYSYYFTRTAPGESKVILPGTEIVTAASSQYLDHITVIFIGTNLGYTDIPDLIRQQRAIIDHQTANQDRFIIVGLHTETSESRRELEEAMQEEYGDNYINLREYMATQAMKDAKLTPTAQDLAMMEEGATPASLLSDEIHFNATGYELIGKLLYNKMVELGYFEEVRQALTNNGN